MYLYCQTFSVYWVFSMFVNLGIFSRSFVHPLLLFSNYFTAYKLTTQFGEIQSWNLNFSWRCDSIPIRHLNSRFGQNFPAISSWIVHFTVPERWPSFYKNWNRGKGCPRTVWEVEIIDMLISFVMTTFASVSCRSLRTFQYRLGPMTSSCLKYLTWPQVAGRHVGENLMTLQPPFLVLYTNMAALFFVSNELSINHTACIRLWNTRVKTMAMATWCVTETGTSA